MLSGKEEKEEAEAWRLMKENPQNFYRLAKRKTRSMGYIGPFTDDDGKVIEEEPVETLNNEYYKIFLQPSEEEKYMIRILTLKKTCQGIKTAGWRI